MIAIKLILSYNTHHLLKVRAGTAFVTFNVRGFQLHSLAFIFHVQKQSVMLLDIGNCYVLSCYFNAL